MEQPQAAEGHGDAVLVAGIDDLLVADGAAGLHDGSHAGAAGALEGLRKKHPTASTDELLEGCLAEDTLTERTDSRLQWQRVKELLQQRDDRARRVVQLRAMGYSYNEIAAELHISESSARVIEHRTRTWLKQMLAKEGYDL